MKHRIHTTRQGRSLNSLDRRPAGLEATPDVVVTHCDSARTQVLAQRLGEHLPTAECPPAILPGNRLGQAQSVAPLPRGIVLRTSGYSKGRQARLQAQMGCDVNALLGILWELL